MICGKLSTIALLISAIGAINWGLVGAIDINLVTWLGMMVKSPDLFPKITYIIVGIAGIYSLFDGFSCLFSSK